MHEHLERITDYLDALPEDQRLALGRLRALIRSCAPDAAECVSYGVPALCLAGKPLVAYGAGASHCAFYPMDPKILEDHRHEVARFSTSKGTIRFQPDDPIPDAVVRAIVLARVAAIRRPS